MPKYLISVSYIGDGIKSLLKDGGSKRKEAVEQRLNDFLNICLDPEIFK